MYKRETQSWIKHLDFMLLDLICLFFAFIFAYVIYNGSWNVFSKEIYRTLVIILLVLDAMFLVLFNTMHNVIRRGYAVEAGQTVKHAIVLYAALTFLLFAMKSSAVYSRVTVFTSLLIYIILSYGTRLCLKRILRRRGTGGEKRNMILVCAEEDVEDVLRRKDSLDGVSYSGVVFTDRDAAGEKAFGLPVVANVENAGDYICREWVDEVFFYVRDLEELEQRRPENPQVDRFIHNDLARDLFTGGTEKTDINPCEDKKSAVAILIEQCRLMAVPVHIWVPLPRLGERTFIEKVNGFHVITSTANYASPLQLFIKRVIDITGGLVGSLIALVLMAVVGQIIKKQSPGPILFRQERIGRNGKPFKVYKIRSMYVDADERKKEFMAQNRIPDGMMFKMDFDPRVIGNVMLPDGTRKTGIGEFIRAHSLDEFPQFFNVLRNEMSIVGTRPPTVDEWNKYRYHHRARLAFKPGVTGMWQVSGRSNITDFEEVVKLDTEYIEHWSIGLDIRIILKTIRELFSGNGAM